ncbi:hypothetical protein R50073_16410 [Maricurvus nonylphenolicus]|uniref:HTH-like domain-containing protein n=1 Tax=Maricurvus nonylphenolicus TaxID=1008307 RepID=UPI0036F2B5C5
MTHLAIFESIREALDNAQRNQYTTELHLQMIKHADSLKDITAKEFCEGVGLKPSFGTEFSKMRNLTQRLKAAGLNVSEI